MRKLFFLISIVLISATLNAQTWNSKPTDEQVKKHLNWVKQELRKPESRNILVAAHRGDWRNAPENSIQGLDNAITMGVDIVEIDLKMTKDSCLVLMHDKTIDRTTNGKGAVSDFTLDSIKTFRLKSGISGSTNHRIPTFEEYMLAAKDKMYICIDKGYPYLKQILQILKKTGTLQQIMLNSEKTPEQNLKDYGKLLNEINYKAVVNLDNPSNVVSYMNVFHPQVIELVFSNDSSSYLSDPKSITSRGIKIWHNALWASLCAGHEDDIAVEQNRPQDSWEWLINHGATIIQTDRPEKLLLYLKESERHL